MEHKSNELKPFLNEIGTLLHLLEEGTPWANKAELFIGILKEAVCRDMKESGSPIPFWDFVLNDGLEFLI